MTTKSGTNSFHGSAYEYLRNKVLNANNFFSSGVGNEKQAWEQNQYSANLGGRILKDKAFAFISWENYSLSFGIPTISFVPTLDERAGDFSADAPIYDPLTTQGSGHSVSRTQFAYNGKDKVIPPSRIDYAANVMANVLKYWPEPNVSLSSGNFFSEPDGGSDQSEYNGRIDYNLGAKHRLFARYTYAKITGVPFSPLLNNYTAQAFNHMQSKQAVNGDTYTLSPKDILSPYARTHMVGVGSWVLVQVKALPSLIDGLEAHSRDAIANLWRVRTEKRASPDYGDFQASEEPGQGRRSLPAQRTLDAVRSLPYSGESGRSSPLGLHSCERQMPVSDRPTHCAADLGYSDLAI